MGQKQAMRVQLNFFLKRKGPGALEQGAPEVVEVETALQGWFELWIPGQGENGPLRFQGDR